MAIEILSSEIIPACLKEHGKGELFFRGDGLEFEARRAKVRQAYLASHPEISEKHRLAISKTAITPGMTKLEVTAAWGLLEEDTRMALGNVTDDEHAVYGYFTGLGCSG